MAINPLKLGKLKKMGEQFTQEHPKVLPYFRTVADGYLEEGSLLEMNVTAPDGRSLKCNFRLTANDVELLSQIAELGD